MKFPILAIALVIAAITTLSGCAPTRTQACPKCTDAEWRQISNPGQAERQAANTAFNKQKLAGANNTDSKEKTEQDKLMLEAQRRKECAIKYQKILKSWDNDERIFEQLCSEYVKTGYY